MRTIAELISGVGGAGNGTAEIYTRNGGATATWYEDFEGTVAHTTGSAISLDSNGGAVAYVNQEVLVRVKDSTGTVVREFVSAGAAPGVEVNSQSFTGSDYTSGQTGVLKPTTAQAVFDLWKTNAGGIDWNVLTHDPTSASQTLKAIGAAHHRVFVVTDPAYGATGDGTTDDSVAVNAAFAAATAAGGGVVYFPPGTYRITQVISVGAGTDILGAGEGESIISMDHATNGIFNYAAGDANLYQRISNMALSFQQANTGYCVQQAADGWLIIENCVVGNGAFSNGQLVKQTASTCKTVLLMSFLLLGTGSTASSQWVEGNATAGEVWLLFCNLAAPTASWSATNGGVEGFIIKLVGNKFTLSPLTGGSMTAVLASSGGELYAALNDFSDDGSGTVTALGIAGSVSSATRFYEFGNNCECEGIGGPGTAGSGISGYEIVMGSRQGRVFATTVTAGAAAATPETREYDTVVYEITDTGNPFTLNLTPRYQGQTLSILFTNTVVGTSSSVTLDTAVFETDVVAQTLASGQVLNVRCVAAHNPSDSDNLKWFQLGAYMKA